MTEILGMPSPSERGAALSDSEGRCMAGQGQRGIAGILPSVCLCVFMTICTVCVCVCQTLCLHLGVVSVLFWTVSLAFWDLFMDNFG